MSKVQERTSRTAEETREQAETLVRGIGSSAGFLHPISEKFLTMLRS
jgi:hypothetical protein